MAVVAWLLAVGPAWADDPFATTTNNGQITITGYTGSGGEVNIPNTINSLPVVSIAKSAFRQCTSLTSVTIPSCVTSIGNGAFCFGCTRLTSITVSPQNSVYRSVDGVLFNHNQTTLIQCPPAKAGSYTIPPGVITIGTLAFHGCGSLTSVAIPASVTSIEINAFRDCRGLARVTIPASVTGIQTGAFTNCANLTSAVFQGNAPTMGKIVFKSTASSFTVTYHKGASGFSSPTWTDSAGDSYPAVVDSTPLATAPQAAASVPAPTTASPNP